jgi:type I restriction enzyme S subunit
MSQQKRLGDVADFLRGITFKPEDVISVGERDAVVCMRTRNIQATLDVDDLIAVPTAFVRRDELYLREGDILISSANSWNLVGKVARVPALPYPATAGGFIAIVRAKPGAVDPEYLYRWLSSEVNQAAIRACGRQTTNISNLSVPRFLNLPITLPEQAGQARAGAVLDKAFSLHCKHQEAIRLADEFLKALFYEKFGDPVTNPKNQPTCRIDELCEVATGSTPARNRKDYYEGTHPWIKTGEVDTPLITHAEEYISDIALAETNCKLFPVGTLLIAMYGQGKTRGKVGMLGIPAATNQACAAILPSENIDHYFLYMQLSLMYEHLRAMGRGGNQENLNLGMIKSLVVIRPPKKLVEEFVRATHKTRQILVKMHATEIEMKSLSNALSFDFFARNLHLERA